MFLVNVNIITKHNGPKSLQVQLWSIIWLNYTPFYRPNANLWQIYDKTPEWKIKRTISLSSIQTNYIIIYLLNKSFTSLGYLRCPYHITDEYIYIYIYIYVYILAFIIQRKVSDFWGIIVVSCQNISQGI